MITTATVEHEQWKLAKPFAISHTTYHHDELIVVTLGDGQCVGRAEASPTEYYDETVEGVRSEAQALVQALLHGGDWQEIHDTAPPGAARNAVDCAIWDLRAKRSGKRIWELTGLPEPKPCVTAITISLGSPAEMEAVARGEEAQRHHLLKLKLGDEGDMDRVRAVRNAAPDKRIIVDANQGWNADQLDRYLPMLRDARIEMVEQPLPAGDDAALDHIAHLVPIGADESFHTTQDFDRLGQRYEVFNIKLDKTGGLTEALNVLEHARASKLALMVGCMGGTSLAMAPAFLLTPFCQFVDLDGPLLSGSDRDAAMVYQGGLVHAPSREFWG